MQKKKKKNQNVICCSCDYGFKGEKKCFIAILLQKIITIFCLSIGTPWHLTSPKIWKVPARWVANSEDPDQMLHSAASDPWSTLFAWANLSQYLGLLWYCFVLCELFVQCLTLVLLNPDIPCLCNGLVPDQLASLDLVLHCLPSNMWIYSNNPDQVIWLAEN